jgi:hypothetical protein
MEGKRARQVAGLAFAAPKCIKVMFFALWLVHGRQAGDYGRGRSRRKELAAGERVPKDRVLGGKVEGALVPRDAGASDGPEPLFPVRLAVSIRISQGQDSTIVRAVLRSPDGYIDIPIRSHRHVADQAHTIRHDDRAETGWKGDSSVAGIAREGRGRHLWSIRRGRGDVRRAGGVLGAVDDGGERDRAADSQVFGEKWSGHLPPVVQR